VKNYLTSVQNVTGSVAMFNIASDVEVEITTKCKQKSVRRDPYMLILGGPFMKGKQKSLLQLIKEMSFAEKWFFLHVATSISCKDNTAYVDSKTLTKAEVNKKISAYKTLKEKNIIRRVKREYYMVNPRMIQLTDEFQSSCEAQWDSLV